MVRSKGPPPVTPTKPAKHGGSAKAAPLKQNTSKQAQAHDPPRAPPTKADNQSGSAEAGRKRTSRESALAPVSSPAERITRSKPGVATPTRTATTPLAQTGPKGAAKPSAPRGKAQAPAPNLERPMQSKKGATADVAATPSPAAALVIQTPLQRNAFTPPASDKPSKPSRSAPAPATAAPPAMGGIIKASKSNATTLAEIAQKIAKDARKRPGRKPSASSTSISR